VRVKTLRHKKKREEDEKEEGRQDDHGNDDGGGRADEECDEGEDKKIKPLHVVSIRALSTTSSVHCKIGFFFSPGNN
jgi:hypothetical protein